MEELLDCRTCKPPTRYPGCQDHCPAGVAAQIVNDIIRSKRMQRCIINDGLNAERQAALDKTVGRRKR